VPPVHKDAPSFYMAGIFCPIMFSGLFTSFSYMHATYISGQVSTGTSNKSIVGNKVEAVPQYISRNGLDVLYKGFSCTLLQNFTSSSFSDALNTVTAPASGAKGFTPAYTIWDFNTSEAFPYLRHCII
ncbi:MAG: hypothetical protein C4330_12805, partial [Chitinophagaceae bacterium]